MRSSPASRSRARWCETSGWLWSSGPVISQTQRSPPSRNSMIWARVELQKALKNGTKSTMLPASAGSLAIFMSAPRWVAGDLVDAGGHRRRHGFIGHAPVLAAHPQGHVDQPDEDRDLDQRPDHGRERDARADAEHGHAHGDGQLEVVAGGGERQGRGFGVVGADLAAHVEAHEKHDDEVDEQWDGDTHHVERQLHDEVAFEAEHHEDGEQQGDERERADARDELVLVPLVALHPDAHVARDHAGDERDAEVDGHALGDLPDAHVDDAALEAEERRQLGDEDPGEEAVEEHLEDAVEGHQAGGVLGVALGELVPDDDHGDAARQADHDGPDHVLRVVVQKDDRQEEHEELSLIHISEPTRLGMISYAVFCLKKKKKQKWKY